jgi:hypothetical protein
LVILNVEAEGLGLGLALFLGVIVPRFAPINLGVPVVEKRQNVLPAILVFGLVASVQKLQVRFWRLEFHDKL